MSRFRSERFQTASRTGDLTVESGLTEFLAHHERKGDSPSYLNELRSYLIGGTQRFGRRRSWLPLLPWCRREQTASIAALDRASVGSYLDHVRSNATRGDYGKVCAILKRFFEFLILEGSLKAMPLRIEQPKRLKAEIKVFTEDEMLRLRDVVSGENPRDWAIFMLLNDTGLRANELCSLRFEDIRWERRELVVRAAVAKNKSFRIIPLGASLPALRKYRDIRGDKTESCDRFFLAYYSTPVTAGRGRRKQIGRYDFCNSGLTRNGLFILVQKWGKLAKGQARMTGIDDPIYAVMVPGQNDGGGEWIDPVLPVWFDAEHKARDWARDWAAQHTGRANVFKCEPIVDIELQQRAVFTERPYRKPTEN